MAQTFETPTAQHPAIRFAAHCAEARRVRDSLSADEQMHMEAALRFELSRLQGQALRVRMLAGLRHVDNAMAMRLAEALAIDLPAPLALAGWPPLPRTHAARSGPRLQGGGRVDNKTVAVLLADGVDASGLPLLEAALLAAGAVVKRVAPRLRWRDAQGHAHEADAIYDHSAAALFDAAVLPLDETSAAVLRRHNKVGEFVQLQYRHGKALGVLGGSLDGLAQWGLALRTPAQRAGVVDAAQGAALVAAIAAHRHPERFAAPSTPMAGSSAA